MKPTPKELIEFSYNIPDVGDYTEPTDEERVVEADGLFSTRPVSSGPNPTIRRFLQVADQHPSDQENCG